MNYSMLFDKDKGRWDLKAVIDGHRYYFSFLTRQSCNLFAQNLIKAHLNKKAVA